MAIPEFVAEFRTLHAKLKNGTLTAAERTRYQALRAQFGNFALVAQHLGHAGKTLRADFRMAKVLKVEVRAAGTAEPLKTTTIDLASGGFASLVPVSMRVGSTADFTLYLPKAGGGSTPIQGKVSVASSRPQTALFRVSFKFEQLDPAAREQLEIALVDAVLERFNAMT